MGFVSEVSDRLYLLHVISHVESVYYVILHNLFLHERPRFEAFRFSIMKKLLPSATGFKQVRSRRQDAKWLHRGMAVANLLAIVENLPVASVVTQVFLRGVQVEFVYEPTPPYDPHIWIVAVLRPYTEDKGLIRL